MKNRNLNSGDNWSTPKKLYDYLDNIYHFDFDPCPLCLTEITPENDGLLKDWGGVNFVNPPYSRNLKPKFIKKAVEESKKGKICIMLIPSATGTIDFHKYILPYANEIWFVEGRIPFDGINTKGEHVTTKCGMHDSMIIVFDITHKKELKIKSVSIKKILNKNNFKQGEQINEATV